MFKILRQDQASPFPYKNETVHRMGNLVHAVGASARSLQLSTCYYNSLLQ